MIGWIKADQGLEWIVELIKRKAQEDAKCWWYGYMPNHMSAVDFSSGSSCLSVEIRIAGRNLTVSTGVADTLWRGYKLHCALSADVAGVEQSLNNSMSDKMMSRSKHPLKDSLAVISRNLNLMWTLLESPRLFSKDLGLGRFVLSSSDVSSGDLAVLWDEK